MIAQKILIIEDDKHISEALKINLIVQDYSIEIAENGEKGLLIWQEWKPDLIILDIMLPKMDGLSVLKKIREKDLQLPILILSARSTMEDKIKGLLFGVDDYLSKPFNLDEFLLKVRRLLLKSSWYDKKPKQDIYEFGSNKIDFKQSIAFVNSKKINLTEQELKLLKFFIENESQVLSREEILKVVWGYREGITTRTIDNFIVRFRKYFEPNPKEPKFFKSLRSVGYIFNKKE